MKLNHIDLQVPDVQRASAFFTRYFGFVQTTSASSPALAILRGEDGFTLVLQRAKPGERYPEMFHIGFIVDDVSLVRAFHARAKDDGLAPSDVETNGRGTMTYCRTPDGILVEVSCRPTRPHSAL